MSETVIIDKNKLENYEEVVSALYLAMKESSGKSAKAIKALREFLLDWLGKEKYQKNAIDAQNFYFSKKMAEQAIAIFKDNATVSSKNITTYVKNALASIDLDDFFFSTKDVKTFEEKISSELRSIIETIDENLPEKKKQKKVEKNGLEKKTVNDTVKKNLHVANINGLLLSIVPNFLEKNVFSNIRNALKGHAIDFDNSALKIINSKTLKSKNIFTSLYIPDISRLYKRFKRFEYYASRGIIYKTKIAIKRASKRIKQAMDFFFPFMLITKILKTGTFLIGAGLKIVRGTLRFGIRLVSNVLNFAFNTFNFAIKTLFKIGGASINILSKTLQKIGAFKLLKLTAKGMFTFLKTYAGAYLIGYVIGSIYRNFRKMFDFSKEIFSIAKTWFSNNIYTPWMEPILNWFQESGYSFYLQELGDAFGEGSSLSESINNIVDEFTLYDKDGKTILDFGHISRKITTLTEWLKENFTSANLKDIVLDNVAPMAGGMLGSIAGAHLGAALGTMIFPGIGTVAGGIIFSLLGGMAGENLGGIIRELIQDNAPFTKVKSVETKFQKFSRQMFGLRNQEKAAFFSPTKTETIKALQTVGSKVSELDFMDERSYTPLVSSGLFSVKEIKEHIANGKGAEFQKQMAMFKNIGNLSYNNVYKEISSSITAMGERLLNPAHKGAIFKDDIKDSDWDTYLTLANRGKENLKAGKLSNTNPFWYRIIRAMKILENLNMLSNNEMRPKDFLDKYSLINNPRTKADFIELETIGNKRTLKINGKDTRILNLIYAPPPSDKEFKNWRRDYADYLTKQQTLPGNSLPVGGIYTIQANVDKAKRLLTKKNLIYWIPTDTNTGFWKKLFAERQVETQDIQNLIIDNLTKTGGSSSFVLTEKQNDILQDTLNENPEYKTVKKENVLYRLRALSKGDIEKVNKEMILTAFQAELHGRDYTSIEMVEQMLGNKIQSAIDKITVERSTNGQQIVNEFNKIPIDSDFIGMANIINEYRNIIETNSEFTRSKLLPLLKALSDKGMSSEEMGHMFGFIYNAGANSIEQYELATDDTISPIDGL